MDTPPSSTNPASVPAAPRREPSQSAHAGLDGQVDGVVTAAAPSAQRPAQSEFVGSGDPAESDKSGDSADATASTRSAPSAVESGASAESPAAGRHDSFARGMLHVFETLQTVTTALTLAFVFRAFMIEPFIIPTGSMATSLLGAHCEIRCTTCGFEYALGPDQSTTHADAPFILPTQAVCPNCHTSVPLRPEDVAAKAGDRILVHKWPYDFHGWLGPRRWDVIVFKDPADATQNYIKRLVALPGESVEIADGDLFIDGAIARKPAAVQRVMWLPVFDQSHPPMAAPAGRRSPWRAIQGGDAPGWHGLESRVVHYDGLDAVSRTLVFRPQRTSLYAEDMAGYNGGSSNVTYGDVRIVGELTLHAGDGALELKIERPGATFTAQITAGGDAILWMREAGGRGDVPIGEAHGLRVGPGRPVRLEFAHVDYRAYLALDGAEVIATRKDQYDARLAKIRSEPRWSPVALELRAQSLKFTLRGLRVDRDVHYTYRPGLTQRADVGHPFQLRAGEFFVLGDNSARSHDSREWTRVGNWLQRAADLGEYQIGTVRSDQIVGQAFFVYLPGVLPVGASGWWRVPDLGRVRFVR